MQNSRLLRKLSTKKWWPKNNCSQAQHHSLSFTQAQHHSLSSSMLSCGSSHAGTVRICALARHANSRKRRAQARDTARLARGILEHASPVLGSGLSKIGHAQVRRVNRGSWRQGEARGARGRGALGADFSPVRGARGAGQRPQRPCQPWAVSWSRRIMMLHCHGHCVLFLTRIQLKSAAAGEQSALSM